VDSLSLHPQFVLCTLTLPLSPLSHTNGLTLSTHSRSQRLHSVCVPVLDMSNDGDDNVGNKNPKKSEHALVEDNDDTIVNIDSILQDADEEDNKDNKGD